MKKLPGSLAFGGLILLVMAPVIVLLLQLEGQASISSASWSAIRFTLFQALLSALISVVLAIPIARALSRRQFFGRGLMISLLGAPFILPALVAVFGLLAIWGRSGAVSGFLALFGLGPLDIYGLHGVVLAHVFFNLPLATRMILQGWNTVPPEHFRLLAQLNAGPRDTFRLIEIPLLRGQVPGAFVVIFMLCMGSFAVALALGGGPKSTTVELAIYQALRFEFDLKGAAMLALVQFALGLGAAFIALGIVRQAGFGAGLMGVQRRWQEGRLTLWHDRLVLGLLLAFLGLPLIAVVMRGVLGLLAGLPDGLGPALLNSLMVALGSAALSICLALALAYFIDGLNRRPAKLVEALTYLSLAASPFVIGTGLFILINPFVSPFALALPITALINAALTIPLSLRVLLPAVARVRQNYGRLGDGLGMRGWARIRWLDWPQMRGEIGFATGLAAALSMGDLGVITLFAPPDTMTLPLLMHRLMGSYQMESAAGVALILVLSSFALFWVFDKGGRRGNHA